jgi:hypothetical protein
MANGDGEACCSPPVLGRFAAYTTFMEGTSAVAVKSKGQSDVRTSLVWANLSAIINCPQVALPLSPLFPQSRAFDGAQSGAVECQFRNRRKGRPRLIHVKLAVDRAR